MTLRGVLQEVGGAGEVRAGPPGSDGRGRLDEQSGRALDLGAGPLFRGGPRLDVRAIAEESGARDDDAEESPGSIFRIGMMNQSRSAPTSRPSFRLRITFVIGETYPVFL